MSSTRCRLLFLSAAAALLSALAPPARAHEFAFTEVLVVLKPDRFVIDVRCDLDELALGAAPGEDAASLRAELEAMSPEVFEMTLEQLRDLIDKRSFVFFDGQRVRPVVSFPEARTPLAALTDPPTLLGLTARLDGAIPPGARAFSYRASAGFPAVKLTIFEVAGRRVQRETLGKGVDSAPFLLTPPDARSPASLDAPPVADRAPAAPVEAVHVVRAASYVWIGFEHILPKGLDHILFVAGLFFASRRMGPLLYQVTLFTLAHSLTLALATLDVVTLSPRLVEPLIAVSIAYVGIENMLSPEPRPWRGAVVFLLGLLHGLGFAGVLREHGLPQDQLVLALLLFNVGVELGQLAVILILLAAVGWARREEWYRPSVVLPVSAMISLVALYWTVERAVG